MYCNPDHCTVVDIVMMYYAIIVSNVNNVSIVDNVMLNVNIENN